MSCLALLFKLASDYHRQFFPVPDHQRRLAELRDTIEARYQTELKSANLFRRWVLHRKMKAEFAIERNKIGPSDYAMYNVGRMYLEQSLHS
jgi:hypothetical protein